METLYLRESEPPTVDGRTIVARIATYGRVYTPTPTERERIQRGAFKAPLARPSGLVRYRHVGERAGDVDDPQFVYGAVKALREDGDAVIAECVLADNARSDHLLSLVRSGAMSGVSMAATVAQSRTAPDGVHEILRVATLHGVSLTPDPAYADAQVVALRDVEAATRTRIDAERAYWASLRTVRP